MATKVTRHKRKTHKGQTAVAQHHRKGCKSGKGDTKVIIMAMPAAAAKPARKATPEMPPPEAEMPPEPTPEEGAE
jgi:hypothetical protein